MSRVEIYFPKEVWDKLSQKTQVEITEQVWKYIYTPGYPEQGAKLITFDKKSLHVYSLLAGAFHNYEECKVDSKELEELRKLKSNIDNIKEMLK